MIRLAGPGDLSAIRSLLWDYRTILVERTRHLPGIVDHYYDARRYHDMLADLPGPHVPPDGALLVAEHAGGVAACGMILRIGPDTCELKRVFVAPIARGRGFARSLCQAALDRATAAGYVRLVLDTLAPLTEAAALYRGMGFTACPPYHDLPPEFRDHVLFFEKRLGPPDPPRDDP